MTEPSVVAEMAGKLKLLSAAYAAQLPERLAQIGQAWRLLPRGEWDQDGFETLHRMVHSLSGSGKVFGFALLGDAARQLEEYLDDIAGLKIVPNEEQRQRIDVLLRQLQQAFAADGPAASR